MQALADNFDKGSPIPHYLKTVADIHREVLSDNLIALYLHGSVVQGNYHQGYSDLDILGAVSGAITQTQQQELAARLGHTALRVPAFGLELILCADAALKAPVAAMPFEFALSTGAAWGTQVEARGTASDILINMQLCRQNGIALFGAPACDLFAHVPREALRRALIDELGWHLNDLRSAEAGATTANAVLNAARSLYAAQTGEIVSKGEGAQWWLARRPGDHLVRAALDYRRGDGATAPSIEAAQAFVENAIAKL